MKGTNWSRDELYLALNLYLKIPFGQMHHNNNKVIGLAALINRSPSSIAMRLGNFAACDPYHANRGVKGLQAGIPVCKPIWDEYVSDPDRFVYESEVLLSSYEKTRLSEKYDLAEIPDLGRDKPNSAPQLVYVRLTQGVFRKAVLTNYDNSCAVTGIKLPQLLIASHIVPWSKNERERLNPENGICFSALYDKAFDSGLISLRNDLTIILSTHMIRYQQEQWYNKHFLGLEGYKIACPREYPPNPEFLEYHRDTVFIA